MMRLFILTFFLLAILLSAVSDASAIGNSASILDKLQVLSTQKNLPHPDLLRKLLVIDWFPDDYSDSKDYRANSPSSDWLAMRANRVGVLELQIAPGVKVSESQIRKRFKVKTREELGGLGSQDVEKSLASQLDNCDIWFVFSNEKPHALTRVSINWKNSATK